MLNKADSYAPVDNKKPPLTPVPTIHDSIIGQVYPATSPRLAPPTLQVGWVRKILYPGLFNGDYGFKNRENQDQCTD